MSEFPINIKVDPGDAAPKIDRVHDSVARAEKRVDNLTRTFGMLEDAFARQARTTEVHTRLTNSLAIGFGRLGQAMEGRARATEVHNRLNNTLSASMGTLAQAIQREHALLKGIRGDTQAYERDLQSLNAMLARGTISQREHADALARSRGSAGIATPKSAGVFDGVGGQLAGQIAGIAGPAALAATAIGKLVEGIGAIQQRAQESRDATASMLRYKDSIDGARESVDALRPTSKLLQSDLKETTGVFLAVADAASGLGLKERELTDITRTLGMIMKIEDKSIGDSAQVLGTLQFAMEKGNLERREMATLMKQFPPLGAVWRKEFGMTTEELLKAAEGGKLNREQIGRMLTSLRDGSAVLDTYGKRLEVTSEFSDRLNGKHAANVMELNRIDGTLRGVVTRHQDLHGAMLDLANDPWADKRGLLGRSLDTLTEKAGRFWKALQKIAQDPWGDSRSSIAQGIDQITSMLGHAWTEGKKHVEKYSAAAKEAMAESQKLVDAFLRATSKGRPTIASTMGGQEAFERMHEGFSSDVGLPDSPSDLSGVTAMESATAAEMLGDLSKGDELELGVPAPDAVAKVNALDKAWSDLGTNMEQGVLKQAERLGDELATLFMTGEFGWRAMVDAMIKDMTRLAIQQGIMFGFKAAFGPSFGGSAGLDFKVPSFSAGGGGIVGGTGDTDTTPVSFWATQGERVIVQTQGQQMAAREAASSTSGPAPVQPMIVNLDERALLRALQSPMGATAIDNVLRKNPGLLKR